MQSAGGGEFSIKNWLYNNKKTKQNKKIHLQKYNKGIGKSAKANKPLGFALEEQAGSDPSSGLDAVIKSKQYHHWHLACFQTFSSLILKISTQNWRLKG